VRGQEHGVYQGYKTADLERIKRQLAASAALSLPGSPARLTALSHLDAVTTELGKRGELK
jgi:hypothetical protein